MDLPAKPDQVRISIASDVGGIELIHARLHQRTLPPHIHNEYSISVTLRGGVGFDSRGSKHAAPSGVISCEAPGEVHNAYPANGERWEFLSLLVPAAVVRQVLAGMEWRDALPDLPRRIIADSQMVARLIDLYRLLRSPGDLLARQSMRTLVLAAFFRGHSTARGPQRTPSPEHRAVLKARELLHACFAQPISLSQLSEHAGLSAYHFLRTFRDAVGMTPHMYLNQIRVLEAKRRLSDGDTPAQAAVACGFCDQSHMNRQFKRMALMTPGDYRRAIISAPMLSVRPTQSHKYCPTH